jgi:D-galacturonate reductase
MLPAPQAMDTMSAGDVCIIFTPDDTHYMITMAAIERKLHVLVAKPVVKTLAEHLKLLEAAKEHNVLVSQLPICPTKQAAS